MPVPLAQSASIADDKSSNEGSVHGRTASGLVGSPLTDKAAALVRAGLPWPDQPIRENETRALVKKQGVKWNEAEVVRLPLAPGFPLLRA